MIKLNKKKISTSAVLKKLVSIQCAYIFKLPVYEHDYLFVFVTLIIFFLQRYNI